MKKSIIIFFIVFLSYDGISQNSSKIDFWTSLQEVVEGKVFLNLFVKGKYQSTFEEFFTAESLKNTDTNQNTLDSLYNIFLNMLKDEYRPLFENEASIDFDFHNLEVVFNSRESAVIMANSENDFDRVKMRTANKLKAFLRYVDMNNELPRGTFEYLAYRFNVLNNGEKWMFVTAKVNADTDIIETMIEPSAGAGL
ncbi:MAG: hypothetical protein FWE63_08300 [Bacteroidales bacterium]|nr:hypothetical protein [Bacteroidales bacterium]